MLQMGKNKGLFTSVPFLTIVLFSFLKPAGFELNNMHSVNVIINMFRIIFSIIIVIKYLKLQKKISIYIMSQFVFFYNMGIHILYS